MEDAQLSCRSIRVVGERHEGCRAMVDGRRYAAWQVLEIGFGRCKGGREDDRMDVLLLISIDIKEFSIPELQVVKVKPR